MARYSYIVVYLTGDRVTETHVEADYVEMEGQFTQFCEEPDSSTGAGGIVFAVNSDSLVSVEREVPGPEVIAQIQEIRRRNGASSIAQWRDEIDGTAGGVAGPSI